jgi:hypothetical protein
LRSLRPDRGRSRRGRRSKAQNYAVNEHSDPRLLDFWDRMIEGLRKAGLPEE